mgnify:CR=1 FL=1
MCPLTIIITCLVLNMDVASPITHWYKRGISNYDQVQYCSKFTFLQISNSHCDNLFTYSTSVIKQYHPFLFHFIYYFLVTSWKTFERMMLLDNKSIYNLLTYCR